MRNTHIISNLIEIVDGKAVTTSRKLAQLLGRTHHSLLRTINDNKHKRAFKCGHFTRRDWTAEKGGRWYEYLITRRGLEALTDVLRYGARDKIAEAYDGAWCMAPKALPMPEVAALPFPKTTGKVETVEAVEVETRQPEEENQDEIIHELAKWIDELRADVRKTKETLQLYSEMYENEKKRRVRNGDAKGYWHDLYFDLMWNVVHGTDGTLEERLERHRNLAERIRHRI